MKAYFWFAKDLKKLIHIDFFNLYFVDFGLPPTRLASVRGGLADLRIPCLIEMSGKQNYQPKKPNQKNGI